MPPSDTERRIPQHLQQHIVEQAYEEYQAIDQAVWRFVMLQLEHRLKGRAHPSYESGLRKSGISTEHIPQIAEMDACLARFGWGAVCVDGFIPPRAFTEFQAARVLPIAADIRTLEHLAYTPAPDIIHEAAGHAPIVEDSRYAGYLERIGSVGATAFRSPEDDMLYRTIHALSKINEDQQASVAERERARQNFEQARASISYDSEATRVSRLYWWTAEYGLVGTPQDYRIYGAGLLSSLGESHSCYNIDVKKLPLTARVTDIGYDITRAQPQLFVARDFDQLDQVLDEVAGSLPSKRGGWGSLEVAKKSGELCSVLLGGGLAVIGKVTTLERCAESETWLAELSEQSAFAERERLLSKKEADIEDGLLLIATSGPTRPPAVAPLRQFSWQLAKDVCLSGTLLAAQRLNAHHTLLTLGSASLEGASTLELGTGSKKVLVVGPELQTRAGAVAPEYYTPRSRPLVRTPKPRQYSAIQRALLSLYEEAAELAAKELGSHAKNQLETIHQKLSQDFPEDWLLRWNLLQALQKLEDGGPLASLIVRELEALELRFDHKEPIASGLAYLGVLAA